LASWYHDAKIGRRSAGPLMRRHARPAASDTDAQFVDVRALVDRRAARRPADRAPAVTRGRQRLRSVEGKAMPPAARHAGL